MTVTYNQYVNPIAIEAIGELLAFSPKRISDLLAWRYYFLFVAMQIFFFLYAWFGFKETKGFTMEEVGYVFDGPEVVEEIRSNAGLRTATLGKKLGETEHDEEVSRSGNMVAQTAA